MKYQRRRRLYSQNFLHSPELIAKLIGISSIGKNDTVVEIGPGRGLITRRLLEIAGKVIAIELDNKLYLKLKNKFTRSKNLDLVNADFLKFNLPNYGYKVFANIPFIITADIIRKLTSDNNFLEGYLVVQKESARKFIGMPHDNRNQMIATLLKPWFEIDIFWKFKREDFIPYPRVDSVMLNVKRLDKPLISYGRKKSYRDFVVYYYNHFRVARLDFSQFLKLFSEYMLSADKNRKEKVSREAERILEVQKGIQKIHRTRKDRNWYKFRSRRN